MKSNIPLFLNSLIAYHKPEVKIDKSNFELSKTVSYPIIIYQINYHNFLT